MTGRLAADLVAAVTFGAGGAVALIAAIEDIRTRRLRNVYTATIAAIAVVGFGVTAMVTGDGIPVTDMLLGALLFGGPWLVIHLIKPSGIGFGDVKLTAGLGLYLGWLDPILSSYAIVAATLLFVVAMVATRTALDEPKPFGPALVAGAVLVAAGGALLAT